MKYKKDKSLDVVVIPLLLYKKCKLLPHIKKNIKQTIKIYKIKKNIRRRVSQNFPIII
jgi:hypothetical protein